MPFSTWAASQAISFSAPPKNPANWPYEDGQVLVHFQKSIPKETRESWIKTLGYEYIKPLYSDGFLLKVPSGTVPEKVESLKHDPHFRQVTPNYLAYPLSYTPYPFPNDPNYQNGNDEWNVNAVHMDQAWNSNDPWIANASLGRSTAVIAVCDSGIRTTHEDFAGKINSSSWNFYDGNSDVTDIFGHGTAVAGIASADVNNGLGGTGICANCSLLVIKITLPSGDSTDFYLEEGIQYALQNGAKGINISFGAPAGTLDYYSNLAFQENSVVVGGMGNDGSNNQYSPASDPNAIGVGGVDQSGSKCSFSTYGSWIGLVAPICSSDFTTQYTCDSCYGFWTGTSMAAPQVSAMAAILLDLGLSPAATKQCLYTTADTLGGGFNIQTGWGRLNCYRALAAIRPASNLSASGGMTQVTLNWVAPQTTAFTTIDYLISRSNTTGGPYTQIGQTPNGTTLSFNDTSPNPNVPYYYVVQAVDAQGNTTVVSNESSAMATGPTFTPTATTTFTVTSTPTPNYGDMSGFTYEGLWHPVNDLTSPCPNSYTPPWAAYWGIDSQCNFQSGNTNPSTLICPPSLFKGVGTSNFWIWMDTSPNGAYIYMQTESCGGWSNTSISIPQKTWFPISYNQDACSGVTIIASALSATGNTGRGIYIDDVGIGTPIPTFTFTPTGTISPSPTGTPTFNEFAGTPTSSSTPTNTSTGTPTPTPSATPTDTPTDSPTDTPCMVGGIPCTSTFSFTPTDSFTPTNSPTNSPSFTPTYTPTSTSSVTPTPTTTPTSTLNPSSLIYGYLAYPNPVKGSQVTFAYQLSLPADKVTFKLFTTAFRKAAEFNGATNAGANTVPFDASSLANGLYYAVMEAQAGGHKEQKIGKLIVAK